MLIELIIIIILIDDIDTRVMSVNGSGTMKGDYNRYVF